MIDFPTKFVLRITKKDLKDGTPGDCKRCAAAIALNRLFPDCISSVGFYKSTIIRYEDMYVEYAPTRKLFHFVHYFDTEEDAEKRAKMKPRRFTFKKVYDSRG